MMQTTMRWLRPTISVLLVAVLLMLYDASEVWNSVAMASPLPLALAFSLFVASIAVSAAKWRLTLGGVPFRPVLQTYLASMFYSLLPTGQLGGEVSKLTLATRVRLTLSRIAASVVYDKVTSVAALSALGALALTFTTDPLFSALAWLLTLLALGLVGGLMLTPWLASQLVSWEKHFLARHANSLMSSVAELVADHRLLLLSLAAGAVTQGLMIAVYVSVAVALDLSVSAAGLVGAVVIANLATLVPISTAGIGVREVSLAALLGRLGVSVEAAIALSLICLALFICGAFAGLLTQLTPAPQNPASS